MREREKESGREKREIDIFLLILDDISLRTFDNMIFVKCLKKKRKKKKI